MRLDGKIVLVTGASSGIGRAIAVGCARAGADVAMTYRGNADGRRGDGRPDPGARPPRRGAAGGHQPGRGHRGARRGAVRQRFGRVDAWINNAGADILTGDGGRLSRLEKLDLRARGGPARDGRSPPGRRWSMMRRSAAASSSTCPGITSASGMAGENPDPLFGGQGRDRELQQVARARRWRRAIRVNILAPGFIETAFGERGRRGVAARGRASDAARPLGHARGRGRRGGLPGLGRRRASDRPDDHGERWSGDVSTESDTDEERTMPATKEKTYNEAEIAERLQGAARLVLRGRLDPPGLQDRRLADHAHAGERGRLPGRGGVPPSRPDGDLGPAHREAAEPRRRRDHRQGLRARAEDRGGRALAADRAARSRARRTSGCGRGIRDERSPPGASGAARTASCSSPGGSPSRRFGACWRRWSRRSRRRSPSSRSRWRR